MNENDNFALVPKTPAAIEKVVPGAKRLLAGMVADTLALVKKETAVLKRIKPPRIVVVDDDSLFKMYELRIRDWFKTVTFLSFANSDHAWHELSQTDPDFLIVQMPSPGVELLSLLAEKKVKYPILVTSGFFDEKEVRQRCDTIGREGGLIIGPTHHVQLDTPLENFWAMVDTVKGTP